jgi:hypothetical protein
VAEIEHFMPIENADVAHHRHRLVRRVVVVRGAMPFTLEVQPRFDYAREEHDLVVQEQGVVFRSPSRALALEGSSFCFRRRSGRPVGCSATSRRRSRTSRSSARRSIWTAPWVEAWRRVGPS